MWDDNNNFSNLDDYQIMNDSHHNTGMRGSRKKWKDLSLFEKCYKVIITVVALSIILYSL